MSSVKRLHGSYLGREGAPESRGKTRGPRLLEVYLDQIRPDLGTHY